jgi:hypothetical protein
VRTVKLINTDGMAFDREWDAEMLRHRLALRVALRDGGDPAHLPEGSAVVVANFWTKTGQLARSGDLDVNAIYRGLNGVCQTYWAILAPTVRRWRAEGDPRVVVNFEWLVGQMAEMDRRAGQPAFVPPNEVDAITELQERLRVEEALRSVVVASPDAPTVAAPAAAPPAPAPI